MGMTNRLSKGSPFLKWAGGKSRLLSQFDRFFPESFNSYIEPFLGGGAVFFHLAPTKALLSDTNPELVNCYRQVKENPEKLMELLSIHRKMHLENGRDYYYSIRGISADSLGESERAARMIYLNKTCYNGLYRVNSKGEFNVPFGRYKNPGIFDRENLLLVSDALRGARIETTDFRRIPENCIKGDFVYLDPPYHPLSATANFTNYTRDSFGLKDQEDLSVIFRELHEKGVSVMLSNSDTPLIRELYKGFYFHIIMAARCINSRGDGRRVIPELLILNYNQ